MDKALLDALLQIKEVAGIFAVDEAGHFLPLKKSALPVTLEAWLSLEENKYYEKKLNQLRNVISKMLRKNNISEKAFMDALVEFSSNKTEIFDELLNNTSGLSEIIIQESNTILEIKSGQERDKPYALSTENYLNDADSELIKNLYDIYNYDVKYPEDNILEKLKVYTKDHPDNYKRAIDRVVQDLKTVFATLEKDNRVNPDLFANQIHVLFDQYEFETNRLIKLNIRTFLAGNIYEALAVVKGIPANILLREGVYQEDFRRQQFMRTADMPVQVDAEQLKRKYKMQDLIPLINVLLRIKQIIKDASIPLTSETVFSGFGGNEDMVLYLRYFVDTHVYKSDQEFLDDSEDLFDSGYGDAIARFLNTNMDGILKKIKFAEKHKKEIPLLRTPNRLESVVPDNVSDRDIKKALGAINLKQNKQTSISGAGIMGYIRSNPYKFTIGIILGVIVVSLFIAACIFTGGALASTIPILAPTILKIAALADIISTPAVISIGIAVGGILGALLTAALDKAVDTGERIIKAIIFALNTTAEKPTNQTKSEASGSAQISQAQDVKVENKGLYKHDFIERAAEAHQDKDWRHKEKPKDEVESEEPNQKPPGLES